MSAVYGQETNRRSKLVNNIVMVLSSLLLLPCKGFSLLPLVVLPLMLIPRILQQHKDKVDAVKQKIKPWMKVLMIVIAGIFVVACVMVLVLVVRRWLQPENINSTHIAWSDSKGYTMGYFLKNPIQFFEILLNTLWYESGKHIQQMLGSYLGWLDIEVPLVFVIGFLLLLLYVSMRKENEEQNIKLDRIDQQLKDVKKDTAGIVEAVGFSKTLRKILIWVASIVGSHYTIWEAYKFFWGK